MVAAATKQVGPYRASFDAMRTVHAWLMLLPALVLLVAFTHWPAVSTLHRQLLLHAHAAAAGRVGRPGELPGDGRDPVFWKAVRNNLWFAGATIPLSIGLALVMALWVNERIAGRAFLRMAYFTPTVLPMIAVANIWLFFYTPQYGLLEQITGALGLPSHNWLGSPSHRAGRRDGGRDLEGGRLLHDLLPGRAADPEPEPARGRGDRRRVALVLLPPRAVAAADADHAVRAGQRRHQRLPHGRPPVRAHARRARQRIDPAAVPPLRSRLQLLGHRLCRGDDGRAAGGAGQRSRCSSSSCSTSGCITSDCAARHCAAARVQRADLARHRRRLAAGAAVDPAAGLRGLDRVPPARLLDPLRPVRAAHAGQLPHAPGPRRRSHATS